MPSNDRLISNNKGMIGFIIVLFLFTAICLLAYYICKDDTHYRALRHITNTNPYFIQKVTQHKECEEMNNEAYILDIPDWKIEAYDEFIENTKYLPLQ